MIQPRDPGSRRRSVVASRAAPPRPPAPRWRLRTAVVAVGLVVVAVVGWIGYAEWARAHREVEPVERLARGQGRWVPTDDALVYVREWGRPGDRVVLLAAGAGGWSGTWFSVPDELAAAGWHVVAADLPPFGLTRVQRPPGGFDYRRRAQARRLIAVASTLSRPVVIVAHGDAAGPALEAALADDRTIGGLVLVDPSLGLDADGEPVACDPGAMTDRLLAIRPLRTALIAATLTWPGFTRALLRHAAHAGDGIDPERTAAYQVPLSKPAFSADVGDWLATMRHAPCDAAESLDPTKLRRWSTIHPPVRLIWGSDDPIASPAGARTLQRWLYGATLTGVVDAGHLPQLEQPRAFAKALRRVLETPTP